jgi:hypothetical protein
MHIDLDYIKIEIDEYYIAGEIDSAYIITQIGKRLHTRDIHEDEVIGEVLAAMDGSAFSECINRVLDDYECVPKDKNLSLWMKDTETVQKIYDEIKESYHWQHLVK